MNRRNLTPPIGIPVPGLPPTRRATGGARRNVSYRVSFFRDPAGADGSPLELPGWALNISRGGLRAIVEDRVDLGEELDVDIAEEGLRHRGRIVWTQEEPDGMIVGVEFLERLHAAPPGVELDSSIEISPAALARQLDLTPEELKQALEAPAESSRDGEP
ncbi:Hypothetical protein A7982_03667 [Minicystis rosea]|nr:Hypothetical protein A7982_03667 [Minicystis rosea]